MTSIFSTDLGRLEVIEVYDYYDGPKILACRNRTGQSFLGLWIGENELGERWLLVPLSPTRFRALRAGQVDLRTAITQAEDRRAWILESGGASRSVLVEDLDSLLLPESGEGVTPPIEAGGLVAAPPTRAADLQRLAAETGREYLDAVVESPQHRRGEAGATFLATFLQDVQGTVTAIGKALKLSSPVDLSVVGVFPGSFGVRLASAAESDLLGRVNFASPFRRFIDLASTRPDDGRFHERLEDLGPRATRRYRSLIQDVVAAGASVSFDWVSPDPMRGGSASLDVTSATSLLLLLSGLEEEPVTVHQVLGRFIGLNLRLKTFEIIDESGLRITGRIGETALAAAHAANLTAYYDATVRETFELNPLTAELKRRRELVALYERHP
jgi:hypothetical protein